MRVLIDNGRIRSGATGLGQVSLQFAAALCRAQSAADNSACSPDSPINFQFLTHPAFAEFAAAAAQTGATHLKGKFSPWNKLRRIFNKDIFAYRYDGDEHNVRHALHRQHMEIPAHDKTPFVFTVHDMHILQGGKRSKVRNLRRMRDSVSRADFIAFISRYSRDITAQNIDISGKEIAIIYNGVDKPQNPERPPWFRDEMRPFLFSVAQIAAHKNYHILPPMMRHLPGTNLVIAGKHKADGIAKLKDSIARENMRERVLTPGVVSDSEKAFLLRECAGFVFPSLKEGFGMPVIEAFHFGKPVFCFANTALPEVGGEHAHYWQNEEAKKMAELVREKIAPPDSDTIAARQKWAQNFSWDKNAAAYIDIYRRLGNGTK